MWEFVFAEDVVIGGRPSSLFPIGERHGWIAPSPSNAPYMVGASEPLVGSPQGPLEGFAFTLGR